MKRLLLIVIFLLAIAGVAQGQVTSSYTLGTRLQGTTLPASCTDKRRLFTLTQTDGANAPGLYRCNGSNYVLVGGGGGITNSAGANVIPKSDGTNLVTSNLSDSGTLITAAKPLTTTSVSTTGTIVHTGPGLNDMTKSGTFTALTGYVYTVAIDATGTPDTFSWDDGAGGNSNTGIEITGAAQLLSNGVSVTFAATTGHTLADSWVFTTTATPGVTVKNAAGTAKTFLNGDENLLNGNLDVKGKLALGPNGYFSRDVTAILSHEVSSDREEIELVKFNFFSTPTADGTSPQAGSVFMKTQGTHAVGTAKALDVAVANGTSGATGKQIGLRVIADNYIGGGVVTEQNVAEFQGGSDGSAAGITTLRTLLLKAPIHDVGTTADATQLEIEDPTASATATKNIWSKGATSLNVFEGAIINTGITSDATHTDSTVCQDTTTHQFYAGSGTLGVCLGTSSLRYKTGVRDLGGSMSRIMALRARSFFYKPGYGDGGKSLQFGFGAEEAPAAYVANDASGKPNSVDLLKMIPDLVATVQAQQRQIVNLQRQVRRLRHRR